MTTDQDILLPVLKHGPRSLLQMYVGGCEPLDKPFGVCDTW
jgi:hypothetical protein